MKKAILLLLSMNNQMGMMPEIRERPSVRFGTSRGSQVMYSNTEGLARMEKDIRVNKTKTGIQQISPVTIWRDTLMKA